MAKRLSEAPIRKFKVTPRGKYFKGKSVIFEVTSKYELKKKILKAFPNDDELDIVEIKKIEKKG